MAKLEIYARSHCTGARLTINIDPELKGAQAETYWLHGKCSITLHPRVLKYPKKKMAGLLIHEFTHVVEYLNDPAFLSAQVEDECTWLAQTMEKQLAPLIMNLKMEKLHRNPFK